MTISGKQANSYRGEPPRAWIRMILNAVNGAQRELVLVVDTGSPCSLIVDSTTLEEFMIAETSDVQSNFGPMAGGWVHIAIPLSRFHARVEAFGGDQVIATVRQSHSSFQGVVGLPMLRTMRYGGDADSFWLEPPLN